MMVSVFVGTSVDASLRDQTAISTSYRRAAANLTVTTSS